MFFLGLPKRFKWPEWFLIFHRDHIDNAGACDPQPQGENQTLDIETKEERESTQRGLESFA